MSRDLKYEKANIELRRGKVLELLSKGNSQTEIAKTLNVSNALISLDLQYIKEKAQKELETHIEEKIPLEYTRAMTGLNSILKKANETLENATDTKTKLQTMALLMELYKNIMTLTTDGGVVEQALKMVKVFKPLPGETIPSATESEIKSDNEDADIIEESEDVPTEQDLPKKKE
jgi:predicted transcriptional regulator